MWKKIEDFPNYEVSDCGSVRMAPDAPMMKGHKSSTLELKPLVKRNGYYEVCLYRNGERKYVLVHRLVAKAFIENPNNLPQVNHKDENKLNNSVSNLEWCDGSYNARYGTAIERKIAGHNKSRSKRAEQPVAKIINGCVLETYKSIASAARENKLYESNIRACLRGRLKSCGGFIWKRISREEFLNA